MYPSNPRVRVSARNRRITRGVGGSISRASSGFGSDWLRRHQVEIPRTTTAIEKTTANAWSGRPIDSPFCRMNPAARPVARAAWIHRLRRAQNSARIGRGTSVVNQVCQVGAVMYPLAQ